MRTLCARLSRTLIYRCLNNTQRNSLIFVSRYGKARKYGTVYELAPGAEFVFWVFFALTVVPLGAGLWHALRDPKSQLG